MLTAGTKAPDFTLPRDGGGSITLSALRSGKVVVYFYPKDSTPACTLEAQEFSARIDEFAALGCTVIGISKDSVKSHDKFCQKQGLKVVLASDEADAVCEAFGAWGEKSMYGKTYMGIIRSTFLIDGGGTIAQVWPKVSAKGHADEVLAALRAL